LLPSTGRTARRTVRFAGVAFLLRAYAYPVRRRRDSEAMAPGPGSWDHRRKGKLRTPVPTYVLEGASLVEGPAGHEGPLLPREEQQLIEGLLAGDDAAIRALYGRFGRPVYTMGLRLLGSREAAEELTQDVFLTAWRKAARFDPQRGRLSTWLMTIAHNLAVDRLRRDTGVSRPHLVLVDEVPDRSVGDEEYVLIERDEAIRALASLSDAVRPRSRRPPAAAPGADHRRRPEGASRYRPLQAGPAPRPADRRRAHRRSPDDRRSRRRRRDRPARRSSGRPEHASATAERRVRTLPAIHPERRDGRSAHEGIGRIARLVRCDAVAGRRPRHRVAERRRPGRRDRRRPVPAPPRLPGRDHGPSRGFGARRPPSSP